MNPWLMIVIATVFCASAAQSATSDYNVPFLVEHDTEAHMIAGALVTWGLAEALPESWPEWVRYTLGCSAAWGMGWAKEKLIDSKPDSKDANAWAAGGALVLGWKVTF